MTLSEQLVPTATLDGFLRWAVAAGFRVGENPRFGTKKVTPGVHIPGSFHYRGLAADLNADASGPGERAKLLVALTKAEGLGLALIFARDGIVGTAATHRNHLHVDVGKWSNYGLGTVQRRQATVAPDSSGSPTYDAALAAVQERLNRNYPAYAHLVVDGINGPETRKAVAEFQRRSGLTVDSIAGPATRARLGL